ncbi:hypothetical protein, partial [Corallococcus terminator]
LQAEWISLARKTHPTLAPLGDLMREAQQRIPAPDTAFQGWARTVPCDQLQDTKALLPPSIARLRMLARTQPRCADLTAQLLEFYLVRLSPEDLIDVTQPLTSQQLLAMRDSLRIAEPARTEALFIWALERDHNLVHRLTATPSIVSKLLSPVHANRRGGREALLDALLGRRGLLSFGLSPEAFQFVVRESLKGKPPPERVAHIAASSRIPLAEKQALLAGLLRSRDPRLRAAAAGGLARTVGAVIPQAAARACVAELRTARACMDARGTTLAAPPPR